MSDDPEFAIDLADRGGGPEAGGQSKLVMPTSSSPAT
jgi:hypothetical protein